MRVHESPESASPSVTRAVAAYLKGEAFHPLELPAWQRSALALADRAVPWILPKLVRWENARRALPTSMAKAVRIEDLAADRVADYQGWQGTSKVVVIGSALGGAAAYLSAILGAPFLPEPFILGFQGGSPEDHIEPHLRRAVALAEQVAAANPSSQLISHFDPVHDGWLTGFLNHLRLKLGSLPVSYKRFIKRHLETGGTLLHLNCQAEWLSFQMSKRHRYQVGGWGGIGPEEFLEGSRRIDRFLAGKGSPHRGGWRVPGVEPSWQPESEWGSEPSLGEALEQFAMESGYRYQALSLRVPHDYSLLAYLASRVLYDKQNRHPQGIFVGMFNQYDPGTILNRKLLPLWLVFNTEDSLAFLRKAAMQFQDLPVYFSALVTYSRTPDMVPWEDWRAALVGLEWYSVGARPDRYPEDTISLWAWQDRLKGKTERMDEGGKESLEVNDLMMLAQQLWQMKELVPLAPIESRSSQFW
ncbi:MAG: hypothetical protein ACLFWD_11860 [Anaerolineales bacterium]